MSAPSNDDDPSSSVEPTSPTQVRVSRSTCPVCGRPTEARYRPFCSRRCADVDLGRWLTGSYVVPGNPTLEDD